MSRSRRRARREAMAAILPNMLTLGNAACGFGAIVHIAGITADIPVMVGEEIIHEAGSIGAMLGHPNTATMAVLVLCGMLFDILDGRVARMTNSTSDLGGQLDSFSDIVTFGLVPAFLVWKLVHLVPVGAPGHLPSRLGWALALLYLGCAILRLARYNIESEPEDSHEAFSGLPTPGAAGAVVVPFLLFWSEAANLPTGFCIGLLYALPIVAVAAGALMVSRVPYVHFLSWLLKGRKPFARLVEVIFALVLASVFPYWFMAIGFFGYACTGPVIGAWRFLRPKANGDASAATGGAGAPGSA
ncbi:MAG: CDP-alcohol phosphatidyltransferase family protein [Planctomycetota bacterium]|jgi:CDP-diacylglycerol--serine O-phosphatidyltransferase